MTTEYAKLQELLTGTSPLMTSNSFSARIQAQIVDFCVYMLWKITERQVVYAIYKKRRYVPKEARSKKHGFRVTVHDSARWNSGLLTTELADDLFSEEFGVNWLTAPLKYTITKLHPSYMKTFRVELVQMMRHCITEGYIEVVANSYPERIRDTVTGRRLLSIWYYPRVLIEYEPVRDLLKEFLKWGAVAFLGYIGITQTISAIISRHG